MTSTLAPASSSFFLAASASALATASLTGFGAPSTRSLASFRPRPVSSRTALMTLTLFAPASSRTTVNSVCSSAAAAAPPAAGAATATAAAAADTPNFSSISLISSDSSSTVMPAMASRISALLSAIFQNSKYFGNARVWVSLRRSANSGQQGD
ncbi:50S ribosomal protein L7/L12 [Achromobacter marplatensis]|nr:50S ribosomal protein L7/L12 [Achromobacter marplatensis]